MSKYGVFSGLHFPTFGLKYRPEKTPYLDTFHAVCLIPNINQVGLSETLLDLKCILRCAYSEKYSDCVICT